jgi:CRISPR-associated exonuclease Cas4
MAYVKASEIREFMFCERAWWLKRNDYFGKLSTPDQDSSIERLEAGIEYHQAYSRNVRSTSAQRNIARTLLISSAVLLILALLSLFLSSAHAEPPKRRKGNPGVTVTTQGLKSSHAAQMPINIGTVLGAVGAIALSIIAFVLRRSARAKERRWQMPRGKVISVDDGNGITLTCPKLELVGRIDVILRDGKWFMPEERKTTILEGKSPLDGDVLQVFAYCYLINANLGPVQKGILKYQNQRFDLNFSQAATDSLIQVLQRIKSLQNEQNVNRSHQFRARCVGCRAHTICFQSLA